MKVEVDILSFPSLIVFMVSMDLKLELGMVHVGSYTRVPCYHRIVLCSVMNSITLYSRIFALCPFGPNKHR